jgi:hypothetical protein
MTNNGQFGPDLAAFVRRTLERADVLKRAVAIKLFSSVIRDSPVGDPDLWKSKPPVGYVGGRFRANWNCTVGTADTSTSESTNHAGAIPAMIQVVQPTTRHDINWLSNSLPYAARLEYEGWSRQAPAGMVRRNTARIKRLISQELANTRRLVP